jgi:(p)ppGpp synthase/HD superfamily hydrolase
MATPRPRQCSVCRLEKFLALQPGAAAFLVIALSKVEPDPAMPTQLRHPIQMMLSAYRFGALKHRNQTLSDGLTPYFSHVARVTWILRDLFEVDDHEILIATVLHDVLEDTSTTADEIAKVFGQTVADYVKALTKREELPRKQREEEYEGRLLEAPEIVRIAKLADMFDNLSGRVATPRLPRTLANAKRLTEAFQSAIVTPKGRKALERVEQLIKEIESLPEAGLSSGS